jgi:hypothetical protein
LDEKRKRQIKSTVLSVWKTLKGSLHFRFARYLIGVGFLALAGPPIIYAIVLHFFGVAADQLGYGLNPFWDDVTKCVGVLLILVGLIVFFRGEKSAPPAQDVFAFTIPKDWTFQQTAITLARGFMIEFQGFTDDDLHQPMQATELQADNMLEAIPLLRDSTTSKNFPDFDVICQNSRISIRKIDDD